MRLRVAVVGNTAGVGVRRCKALQAAGIDARLFVSAYESGISDPLGRIDAYEEWTWPARRSWGRAGGFVGVVRGLSIAFGLARLNVKLLGFHAAHVLGANVGYVIGWHRPLIAEPMGTDIVEAGRDGDPLTRMCRLGWRRADAVLVQNGDTLRAATSLGLSPIFVPQAIDTSRFSPQFRQTRNRLIVFHPTRQDWLPPKRRHKANDLLYRGIAEYVRAGGEVELRCVAHGDDVDASKVLVAQLGIASRLRWLDVLDEERLVAEYQNADVVADQFQIGSLGQVALEGLACGAVLLTHLSEDFSMTYGEGPPYLEASAPEEVAAALRRASLPVERRTLSDAGRQWALQHHSLEVVARVLKSVYERVTGRSASVEGLP